MTFIVDFMLGVTVGALYYCDFTVKFNVNFKQKPRDQGRAKFASYQFILTKLFVLFKLVKKEDLVTPFVSTSLSSFKAKLIYVFFVS